MLSRSPLPSSPNIRKRPGKSGRSFRVEQCRDCCGSYGCAVQPALGGKLHDFGDGPHIAQHPSPIAMRPFASASRFNVSFEPRPNFDDVDKRYSSAVWI